MSRVLTGLIFFGLLLGACVPNKKIVYLQSEDELKKDFPTDSVLRTYDLANYEYRIQPEDILSIRIESLTEEEYNIFANQQPQNIGGGAQNQVLGGYLVDRNGDIHFPEIGKVKVSGLTLHEVEAKITNVSIKYLAAPAVKVRLLNFRISVLGEVSQQGIISSFNNRMTIMEAIASAGGLNELANRSEVKIIRQVDDNAKVFYVNLLDEQYMKHSSFFLHPNDIVIVAPLKQRPFRRYFGQNLGLFLSTVSVVLLTVNLLAN